MGERPGVGERPTLPGLTPGNRPGNRPGIGDRPIARPPGTVRPPIARPPGYRPPAYRPPRPPAYGYYRGWHHGYWHGNNWRPGRRLNYWWNRYPVLTAYGVTSWSVNRMGWWFGYYPYSNPYATTQVVYSSSYDYSEPLIVYAESPESAGMTEGSSSYSEPAADGPAQEVSSPALRAFDEARQSFHAGRYEDALTQVDKAIEDMPRDAVLHEFRALTLFALGTYQDCAATLYAVLSAGPGWDWTTMSGLYPNVEVYTEQLRSLEDYQRAQPEDPAGHLILAYHYLTSGHTKEATDQLNTLDRLTPNDPVVRNLRLQIDPDAEVTSEEKSSVPPAEAKPVQNADVLGEWTAQRNDGSTFVLKLEDNGQFAWTYSAGNSSQTISGSYALDDESVLTMDTGDSGMMFAQLVSESTGFKFYLLGDTQGQEPLQFKRS